MKKDYRLWHDTKTKLNDADGRALFHEREIWWCALGSNVGFEQDGSGELFTRPVVILTKFNLDVCLVVPLTAKIKEGKYYHPVGDASGRDSVAILSQIRLVDRKRLAAKIATLEQKRYQQLLRAVVKACFPALQK
ncbi:hypothetical protein A3A39_01865 [Candidatus Kaiserbacteria bacterium RIFCSPLOWO2_01_FULL_54_13]|uniref:mRNA interferase n=1 Tax=Candidatus Kaiserbacteria bacterium RIFCSPLOWO2_01_FULL_54_13 TaxID=1798512 RepID=A0A1F6F0C8_9BACT|nr:MAG: hypothetical protein A3A39_01865 [Candidatus Kaiserbacteria bacterium RIFCSPLOWO2_01_FULL_54_13]